MSSRVLDALVRRLATARDSNVAEANVQSDIRTLLLQGELNLDDDQLVELEVQAGSGRRIDIEVGSTVIETKRDLRKSGVRADAEKQLAGYVRTRSQQVQARYVGILTDGAEWGLYHLERDGDFQPVSAFALSGTNPDRAALLVWLESALATVEHIQPTPREVERRLGAQSSAHALDFADLKDLYLAHREVPSVKLKRQLWAKLLTTAFGTGFRDEDDLFVEHTLLVVTAEIIAHSVVGLAPQQLSPASLLSGQQFVGAGITGVIEEDFFDWLIEVDGGDRFVRDLARRLCRFAWRDVEHDVMKVLYESVISQKQRHDLGEYYTPDWLAQRIVEEVVDDPLSQRVLDPSCGSGTFLFWAIRHYLDAAAQQGVEANAAIAGVITKVIGLDVHPLAVTFARVTYLLAIGQERITAPGRPNINVPVYLGDSLQWGQQQTLFNEDVLTVQTDGGALFGNELRFPDRVLRDAGQFDRLVAEFAHLAATRSGASGPPVLDSVFRRYAVHPDDMKALRETFAHMCELHDTGRDHIWSYYVRNLSRPAWLARDANQVDRIVGNPPWLAYRFMTAEMQTAFRAMSEERGLWHGATVATHQDLSGLFLVRAVELYLRPGGRFGLVMPLGALNRRQYAGLRTGHYASLSSLFSVAFDAAWDLHRVKPSIFPVPPSVVFGSRASTSVRLPDESVAWQGRLPSRNVTWSAARDRLMCGEASLANTGEAAISPYGKRFAQGATLVPRMLCLVSVPPAGPLGAAHGQRPVKSLRSAAEKRPWRDLPPVEGSVESQFIRPVHLGSTVLAYRLLEPVHGIIPWDGKQLLDETNDSLGLYPGLGGFVGMASPRWMEHRSSERLTWLQRLDYRRGLRDQFPIPPHRVVYSASGQYPIAARLDDPLVVVEHGLYWASVASEDEGRYLTAILNSPVVLEMVAPLQARGEHNPRHFDKYLWRLPIPLYDPALELHQITVRLATEAESFIATIDLPGGRFETKRRVVRETLAASEIGRAIDDVVRQLLRSTQ